MRRAIFVPPSAKSFAAAAATADWAHAKDFDLVMTDAPGAGSYPITASTFVLMPKQPKNAAASAAARKFFGWALTKGQPQALSLDYVPLPAPLVKRIEASLRRFDRSSKDRVNEQKWPAFPAGHFFMPRCRANSRPNERSE